MSSVCKHLSITGLCPYCINEQVRAIDSGAGKSEHAWLSEQLDAALAKVAELENEATDSMAAFVLVRDENKRLKSDAERWGSQSNDLSATLHRTETQLRELREAAEELCDEAEATVSAHGREYGLNDLSNAAEHARAVLAKVKP